MTNVEISKEEDFEALLKQEEEEIEKMCAEIIKFRPDIVITEKGISGASRFPFVSICSFQNLLLHLFRLLHHCS